MFSRVTLVRAVVATVVSLPLVAATAPADTLTARLHVTVTTMWDRHPNQTVPYDATFDLDMSFDAAPDLDETWAITFPNAQFSPTPLPLLLPEPSNADSIQSGGYAAYRRDAGVGEVFSGTYAYFTGVPSPFYVSEVRIGRADGSVPTISNGSDLLAFLKLGGSFDQTQRQTNPAEGWYVEGSRSYYGTYTVSETSVPEPAGLTLLGIAALIGRALHRRA